MSLREFVGVLMGRHVVVLTVLVCTVAIAVAASLVLPKQYRASASLVIDIKSPDPIAGTLVPVLALPAYVATQVDIINSDRVAEQVVRNLGLAEDPRMRQQWLDATEGKGTIESWLAARLQKKVQVTPARQSNVITISVKGPDAAMAAATANSFAEAYREITLALRVEPAREYAKLFEAQGETHREHLTAAQNRLLDYQQKKGIVVSDQRLDYETARLNELSGQLSVTQGQTAEARSRETLRGGADTHPDVMQSALVQNLKIEIARQEAKLGELSRNLGRNHPQYQQAEAEIAVLNNKLKLEIQNISRSFSTSGNVSTAKQAALRAAIAEQRRRVLELQSQRGELAVLMRDVEAAQKAFDVVSQRFSQTSLESQSNIPNIAILTRASAPAEPVSPKLLLNTTLAIFCGTLLGIGIAFLMEIFDRRVRSSADFGDTIELGLLGVIPPRTHARRIANVTAVRYLTFGK